MGFDKDELEARLTTGNRRRLFKQLGFRFNGHRPNAEGWINKVLGPPELGEGETPNFAINVQTGAVKDHGSSGFSGSLYDAVQGVQGFSFPAAVDWVAAAVGLAEASERPISRPKNRTSPASSRLSEPASDPVASLDTVHRWHERLMSEAPESEAARSYLIAKRGLSEGVIRGARVGLARKQGRRQGMVVEWWIMIPVVQRLVEDDSEPLVVAVKGFAFDPTGGDWLRTPKGGKIARNASSALYDLVPPEPMDGPLLLCEGELDALCALSHGFNAATGTNGAGTFKPEWAAYVARLAPAVEHGVVIGFDGDDAGRKGTPKAAGTLHEAGVDVYAATLPDGRDVSDILLDGGRKALSALVEQASPYAPEAKKPEGGNSKKRNDKKLNEKLRAALGFDAEFVRKRPVETIRRCALLKSNEHGNAEDEEAPTPSDAPPIPDGVFELLPPLLRTTVQTFTRTHERDVYLTSALACLSACMPQVGGYYGELPGLLRPNLYLAVVAGAAGGKSAMRFGQWLTGAVDRHIKKQSEIALTQWKEAKDTAQESDRPFNEPKPPERSLMLPANTSAAAFHEGLGHRSERALVVESEIDTLTNALGQEWGKFDDTLRKAYHHEATSYRRKAEGKNVTLKAPNLSVVLSGTPHQFEQLMGSTENGLYSRFALYYFEAPQSWISQRPSAAAIDAVKAFRERHANRVLALWQRLAGRYEPLRFVLTDTQWRRHEATFRRLLQDVLLRGWGHLSDVVKRAGVVAFRIAMICAVLRAESERPDLLSAADTLEATDNDVTAALRVATTLAAHSLRYANAHLSAGGDPDPWMRRIAVMLNGVAEEFTSGDAYTVADEADISVSQRTLQEDLKRAARQGIIRPIHKNGRWTKAAAGHVASSGSSDVSD